MSKKQSGFSHHVRRDGNVVIVALRGRLDGFAGKGLKPEIDELLKSGAMCLVFDCQELSYIGPYGHGIVLTAAKQLQRRKGRFALCNLAPDLKEMIELLSQTNLNTPIFDSLGAALAAFRMGGR